MYKCVCVCKKENILLTSDHYCQYTKMSPCPHIQMYTAIHLFAHKLTYAHTCILVKKHIHAGFKSNYIRHSHRIVGSETSFILGEVYTKWTIIYNTSLLIF